MFLNPSAASHVCSLKELLLPTQWDELQAWNPLQFGWVGLGVTLLQRAT